MYNNLTIKFLNWPGSYTAAGWFAKDDEGKEVYSITPFEISDKETIIKQLKKEAQKQFKKEKWFERKRLNV